MMGKIFRWAVVLVILVILTSGSVAFYTIFFGGKDLVIPPLREMSVLDAVDEAERIGLEVKIEQVDSSIPAGTVLAQWPEPGTKVRRDKTIIIKISRGGNKKSVPDLRGMETARALKKIQEQGFTLGDTVKINDDSRAAGTVIAQNPAVPAVVDDEAKIDLLVSLGPVPRDGRVPVPDLAQRSEADGKELIAQSGLKFGGT
ncbi:MAG: PASTA domain-containing protein, partial [Synergistaceae bacterium]|nr:PASTA domain-containing protein [Synergistaceae bacterium]